MNKRFGILACLVALTLLTGCERAATPQELLAQAKQYRAKGELNSALIQAKNALQGSPDLAEAHYLMGAIYLDLGEARIAEPELRRALELKFDAKEAVPALARSLFKQEKYQDILDETTPERLAGAGYSAEVASVRGDAFLALKRIPAAKAAYDEALGSEADFPGALVGLAKITAADRRPQEALQLIDRALAKSPSNVDALLLQGDLQRVRGDPQAALLAYQRALEATRLKPEELNARLTLASVQIGLEKYDDATANLAVVLRDAPQSPTANYLQALIEFRKKNFAMAQNRAMEVLKVQPSHMPSIILGGAAEYALAQYPQAEMHLKWALDRYPDSLYIRKLLVATYSKGGKTQAAIDALQPGLRQAPKDANLLALAGDVYMQANQFAKATQYFDAAVRLEPADVGKRLAAGASRLASGETDQAVADFASVVAVTPGQTQASLLLAMAHLRRGELDQALKLASELEVTLPRNPIVRNVKGGVYVGRKDYAEARRAFEQALAIQPSFFPAAANLAQLDLKEGNVAAARKRYDAVLERDPENVQAMLAIAGMLSKMPGQADESMRWVERAQVKQPNDPRIAVVLAKYQFAAGNRARALETARQASILGEGDVQVLQEAAQLQLAAGATRDALDTYTTIARLEPGSAESQYRLASVQYLTLNRAVAKQTLRKTLELKPDLHEALILLAKLEAEGGNRDQAIKLVERVKKSAPNSLSGFALEGDVEMLSKRFASAAKAYERAYAIRKSGNLAVQIYEAHSRAGKPEQGEPVVLKWLQDHPTDAGTRQYLADASMRVHRLALAIPQYEWLAQNQPDNPQVLNNLAWAYSENADPRAVRTAEKAFKIKAGNPAIADTYGWILYRNGRMDEAVDVLKGAVAAAPDSREIRYHYAQALAKTGDRRNARLELERVLAGSTPFANQAEAKPLLDQLRN